MAKYSSFKDQQLLTENFRRFINPLKELGPQYIDPEDARYRKAATQRERRATAESLDEGEEQLDELYGFATHGYKWYAPIHDMLNMLKTGKEGGHSFLVNEFADWYKGNKTLQDFGNAVSKFEKTMNRMWKEGGMQKAKVASMQSLMSLGDPGGTIGATTVGAILRPMRDEMLKKEKQAAKEAADIIQNAKDEASAVLALEKFKKIATAERKASIAKIQKMQKMLADARATASPDSKERMAPVTMKSNKPRRGWRPSVTEGITHQILTENFRNFIKAEK